MSLARRIAAALAVTGVGVLAFAVPVAASSDADHDSPPADCVDGPPTRSNLSWTLDSTAAHATVHAMRPFCNDVVVLLGTYKVPDTWDGAGWNATAAPQDAFSHDWAVLEGTETVELDAPAPDCGNVQTDLYFGRNEPDHGIITHVTYPEGHGGRFIDGGLWPRGGFKDSDRPSCKPSHSPTPTESPSPTPTKSPSPTPTTPSPTPTDTTVPPTETPTPPPTTQPAGPVIPVTPPPAAAPVPPQEDLAQTGSSATLPLIGLGTLLLGAGIVLSLLGRRQTA
jgi:hypothetical protein